MNRLSFLMKSSVVVSGILILGFALSGCASSGKKCLQWADVTIGQMPSGAPITERRCVKEESEEDYQKRMQKEKEGY